MSYSHFGEIGDVWKHLPLAEILSIEPIEAYWESHAASGLYELQPTAEQEYGAIRYLERAVETDVLRRSTYTRILETYCDGEGRLARYPGSPVIAMSILGHRQLPDSDDPTYLFCDTEAGAIDSLRIHAQEVGISETAFLTVHGDGPSTLAEALSKTPSDEVSNTFVHIDPYWPGDRGTNGLSSWDVFSRLVEKGARAMLWYGYQTKEEEAAKIEFFKEKMEAIEFVPDDHNLWGGEIVVNAFRESGPNANHPGVFGSGVVCGNLGDRTIDRCWEAGAALVSCYSDAVLPDGNDGTLSFAQRYW